MSIDKIDSTNCFEAKYNFFRSKAEELGSQVRLGEAEVDQTLIDQLVELVIQLKAFLAAKSGTDEAKGFEVEASWDKEHWFGNCVTNGFDIGMLKGIPKRSPEWERLGDLTDQVFDLVLEQSMDRHRSSFKS